MTYRVADNIFNIDFDKPCQAWEALEWHYAPFQEADTQGSELDIDVCTAPIDPALHDGMTALHTEGDTAAGMLKLDVYQGSDQSYRFEITQPGDTVPNASLDCVPDFSYAKVTLAEGFGSNKWRLMASLTAAIQLAYMLATNSRWTILTHASSVLKDGYAYLFLGKSGTGKSTHSGLWLKNIPDTTLLNDDHPIVRVSPAGEVIAYGSPWSGKTDCYRNLSAPVGGIIRIIRAPYNAAKPLNAVASYASLITSFSGMTFDATQADDRHRTIEQIVRHVPCYQLECLPDDDAAIVCSQAVMVK